MKVLLVHNYYQEPGGEDIVFEGEKRMLTERGHEVREFVEKNSRMAGMNSVDVAISSIWSSRSKKSLEQLLRTHDIDLVHFHNTFVLISPSAYYSCAKRAVPVVQTLHNYRWLCPAATFFRNNHICVEKGRTTNAICGKRRDQVVDI